MNAVESRGAGAINAEFAEPAEHAEDLRQTSSLRCAARREAVGRHRRPTCDAAFVGRRRLIPCRRFPNRDPHSAGSASSAGFAFPWTAR